MRGMIAAKPPTADTTTSGDTGSLDQASLFGLQVPELLSPLLWQSQKRQHVAYRTKVGPIKEEPYELC
jgi:hypothetical protein